MNTNTKKFKSIAVWPKGTVAAVNDISTDLHDTPEQAQAVCTMLEHKGFGGDDKIFPISTRVEPIVPIVHALTPPTIPDNYVAFAKAVADIAAKNGIDRFEMTFRPTWQQRFSSDCDSRIHGDMKISFADVDGRGRPCRNLSINMDCHLSLPIESNPESCS